MSMSTSKSLLTSVSVRFYIFMVGAFLLVGLSTVATANDCVSLCDNGIVIPNDLPIRFCGTDDKTHYTSYEAAVSNYCYFNCNVGAMHQGPCGCPNDCFEDSGHGVCVNSKCECEEGVWGGLDCGSPSTKNTCSKHGTLVPADKVTSQFDHCVCEAGYTGVDCSSETFALGNLPWGEVFAKSPYSTADSYKDAHPVWNISVIATIHIDVDDKSLQQLRYPATMYREQDAASADVHFDNGKLRAVFRNVGMRVRGRTSKMDLKKSWSLSFDEVNKGQKLQNIKRLNLNAGSDDAFLRSAIASDFYRAVGVPAARSSFATVFVNGIYEGLFAMQEDVDEEFFKSRIEGDSGSGNMMKVSRPDVLNYEGDDQSVYEESHDYYPSGILCWSHVVESTRNNLYVIQVTRNTTICNKSATEIGLTSLASFAF
jgi:hypothetical protein